MFGDDALQEDDVVVARKLYKAGFFLLPWLWFVLVVNFYSKSKQNAQLAYYVKRASLGFLVATLVLVTWIAVFQVYWRSWGQVGVSLLVVDVTKNDNW